ncbi:asparagine synthetase B family protein [Niveibacterium sp. 24ML]|uniref:asparagine synthetase B family protein n=1 Tax=Niveibacterium sp. 24ML TaxID=2985512 RepID=UPI0022721B9F|nr:asparagine synthetase B family protein [Niveibacterium sp. 24ML]MCX9156870.1 asparagine synthetase B family protein [Niveibacterium sp. 24ML]
MSARENRLVCRFEPAQLDPSQNFDEVTSGRIELERAGIRLLADGPDVRIACKPRLLVVLIGFPYGRDAALDAALNAHGPAALTEHLKTDPAALGNQLGGRFALLWIDLDAGRIACMTDRFSTRALCWSADAGALSVASRADLVPVAERRVDPQAIYDFLYFHMIPAPRTIFATVNRLEPGHLLACGRSGISDQAWWQPRFAQHATDDLEGLKAQFRGAIRRAVSREVGQGGRVAAFLSGGTDSSTVIGMLRDVGGDSPRGYSIGFDTDGYDEMSYARIAAKAFGVDHREHYVTAQDLVRNVPAVAAHYDQPFGNSSALPAYCLGLLARSDGFDRLLAGDGGDELFGGNSRYAKQKVFELYHAVPGALRSTLIEPLTAAAWARKLPGLRKASSYVEQACMSPLARTEQYNLLQRLGRESVLTSAFSAHVDAEAPLRLRRQVWDGVRADTVLDRELGFDWRFTLADNDLPKVIGTTALAGLDVGFPLLSEELIDLSLTLPDNLKLRGFKLRWFFKEALKDFLPREILEKKKHGFGLPFGHWALTDPALKALSEDSVHGLVARGILREDFVRALFASHLPAHPGYYGEMVWISMMLEQWLRANAPETRF